MGRARSRSRSRRRDKDKDKEKAKEKKEKERKRSRSRRRREERREEPVRERSLSLAPRPWRFDSPPKEEEFQRDAMLAANPLAMGGFQAALQGGLGVAGVSNILNAPGQSDRANRELYVGNLPAGISQPQLIQFLNQVAIAVKVNTIPGDPVVNALMGSGGGQFAFVEFRSEEEAANGLKLNGVELLGCQLKVGRPKGYDESKSGAPAGGQLAIEGGAPTLGQMMMQHGALRPLAGGQMALPGMPGQVASTIDHRLCLVNIPTFIQEQRIKDLLTTFGQLKFFAMQKDEDGKSVGVAFFEYVDMMTQQQARNALEGLALGQNKLSVKRPEDVIELGLVDREQKLGSRVVPSKVLYLKNIVVAEELKSKREYNDICTDIRLEGEKFGIVLSIEVPRPRKIGGQPEDEDDEPAPNPNDGAVVLAGSIDPGRGGAPVAATVAGSVAKARPALPPTVPSMTAALPGQSSLPGPTSSSTALVLAGQIVPHTGERGDGGHESEEEAGVTWDFDVPGVGYAFIEFANVEGCSKAKKGLGGRQFGENLVEAEYFSERKYAQKDFADPVPNTEAPLPELGVGLVPVQEHQLVALDEKPLMVE